jgi:alkylation response protein AidB-like acyl-CoA dehydrogenase
LQGELNEIQRDIQKAAKEFAEKEFDPSLAQELDRERRFPETIFERACRLGFVGINYPEIYGGQSLGLFENVLVTEEFCRRDSGIGIAISMADMASCVILRYGTEEQRKQFIPPVTRGEATHSVAFDYGLNLGLQARAEGSGYLVDGKKSFVLCGPRGGLVVLLCGIVEGSHQETSGAVMLLVRREQEGISLSPRNQMMGLRMCSFHELSFDQVHVSGERRIGTAGKAVEYLASYLVERRIKTAAQALGVAQGAFDRAAKHAREREQFGSKIGRFQGIQFMLAEMLTQVEAARSLVYRAARSCDAASPEREGLASMARLFSTDVAVRTVLDAIQIHGGVGLMKEYSIERMFRDVKTVQNLGETSFVQRALIGQTLVP